MLEINKVNKFFGGLKAVHKASMKVEMGSITGLIGPNGAGKTTLFNTIAGLYDPDDGNIFLNNEDISFLKPHELFDKGVLRTFQIAHEFSTLTVLENLMMVPPNLLCNWENCSDLLARKTSLMERQQRNHTNGRVEEV